MYTHRRLSYLAARRCLAAPAGVVAVRCFVARHSKHSAAAASSLGNTFSLSPALWTAHRMSSTAQQQQQQQRSTSASAMTPEEIIAAADWTSPQFEERLGFRGGDVITEERLKRHYYALAKHYHPDASSASNAGGANSTTAEAFHNVKEAYDAISATMKDGSSGGYAGSGGAGANAGDFAGGFTYSDEARRRAQMRLLSDTVVLFIATTVLFIVVVGRHNKTRMRSRYLWHLAWIFLMIQLFPRLLAAAILFAGHSMYLLDNATLQEQAAVAVVVERRKDGCTVKLDGIQADAAPNVVVQVTTTTTTPPVKGASGDASGPTTEVSSTLTFDKGVTEFLLPVPQHAHAVHHIKAVDEERKLVLVDRTLSA